MEGILKTKRRITIEGSPLEIVTSSTLRKLSTFVRRSTEVQTIPQEPDAESLGQWEWDLVSYPLVPQRCRLLVTMMKALEVEAEWNVSFPTLMTFFSAIERGYRIIDSPIRRFHQTYHSFAHAVDVAQTTFTFLTTFEGRSYLTPSESLMLMVAAVGHDIGHPGLTNQFLIESKNPLALKYDETSAVLETMHASLMLELVKSHRLLDAIDDLKRQQLLRLLYECILSTDMNSHMCLLQSATRLKLPPSQELISDSERFTLAAFLLHCADLSNPAKPWSIAERWSLLIMDEFFEQGELEKCSGMSVSPSCDAHTTNIADLQMKFIKYTILPTFQILESHLPAARLAVQYAEENMNIWRKKNTESLSMDQRSVLRELCHKYHGSPRLMRKNSAHRTVHITAHSHRTRFFQLARRSSRRARSLMRSTPWAIVMIIFTLSSLFADDLREGFFSKEWDTTFDMLTLLNFFVFLLELLTCCVVHNNFIGSFYFWIDAVSTISLLFDFTVVRHMLQKSIQFMSPKLIVALEASRDVRITRTVRSIHMIRIARVIQQCERHASISQPPKKRRSKVLILNKVASNAIFSRTQLEHYFDRLDRDQKHSIGIIELQEFLKMAYNRGSMPADAVRNFVSVLSKVKGGNSEPQNNSSQLPLKPEMRSVVTKSMFIDGILEGTRKENVDNDLPLAYKVESHRSVLGQKLCDLATRRFIVLVLSILFITPMLYVATPTSNGGNLYGLTRLHGLLRGQFVLPEPADVHLQTEINTFVLKTTPLYTSWTTVQNTSWDGNVFNGTTFFKQTHHDLLYIDRNYRVSNIDALFVYGCRPPYVSTQPTDVQKQCTSVAYYDIGDMIAQDAVHSMLRTFVSVLCLFIGALVFRWDTMRLVMAPIERMVSVVEQLAANPLAKVRFKIISEEKNESPKAHNEIQLLEETFIKIASLVQIGFGEAGAEIIRANMPSGDFNAMMPGKRIHAVFGFCDIRRFTDTTECLTEDIMIFTNIICDIVHSNVHKYGGAPNKNIGDAFLLVWKIPETSVDSALMKASPKRRRNMNGHRQSYHFFEFETSTSQKTLDAVEAQEQNMQVLRVADKALIAFIRIQIGIHTSTELAKYRQDPALMKRFPSPYVVRMGYGLHAGWAIEGAIGSQYKIDASYLSSDVNMSQRLEELTKRYKTPMLLSEKLYELLSEPARKLCRCVDRIAAPGSEDIILTLYTFDVDFYQRSVNDLSDLKHVQNYSTEFRELYDQGIEFYLDKRWKEAYELLQRALLFKPQDGPTEYLISYLNQQSMSC